MKKNSLLLSLGTLALVTTPIVLVASCSSPEAAPTLENEVARFAKDFPVKETEKATTSFTAAKAINMASSSKDKWDALGKLVMLPSTNNNFSYDIKGTKVEQNALTSLKVIITITQKSNSQSKEATLTVTNLKQPSALELEAVRFTTSIPAIDATVKTTTALDNINKATTQTAKLKAIKDLVPSFPDVNTGFTLTINQASVDTTTISSINIDLTITQESDKTSQSAIFTITGLTEVKLIDIEANRFSISLVAKDSKLQTTAAIRRITETRDESNKITELIGIVPDFPETTIGFSLSIDSAKIDSAQDTSVNVAITITQDSDSATKTVVLTITGLTAETWQQELTRLSETHLIDQTVLPQRASEIAVVASSRIGGRTLHNYYETIILGEGITYTYKYSLPILNSVMVMVTVTNGIENVSISHEFSIVGFKNPTTDLELEAVKMANPLAATTSGTTVATAIRSINDSQSQAAKLIELKKLVTNFPVPPSEFALTIGIVESNPIVATSIDIPITISQNSPTKNLNPFNPATTVIFTITDLTLESAQEELERLARTLLIPAEALKGEGLATTALEAQKAIKNTTILAQYYKVVELGKGIAYAFSSSKVNAETDNVLDVTVIVAGADDTKPFNHVIKIIFPKTQPA